MAKEFRILHHRYSSTGGHWDLVENPLPYRTTSGSTPHGEGTVCQALQQLAGEGWTPVMEFVHAQAQSGELFILLSKG
jgi:hypothetical protein